MGDRATGRQGDRAIRTPGWEGARPRAPKTGLHRGHYPKLDLVYAGLRKQRIAGIRRRQSWKKGNQEEKAMSDPAAAGRSLPSAGLRTAPKDPHFDRQVIHFRKFLLETKKFRGRLAPEPTRRKSLLSQI